METGSGITQMLGFREGEQIIGFPSGGLRLREFSQELVPGIQTHSRTKLMILPKQKHLVSQIAHVTWLEKKTVEAVIDDLLNAPYPRANHGRPDRQGFNIDKPKGFSSAGYDSEGGRSHPLQDRKSTRLNS